MCYNRNCILKEVCKKKHPVKKWEVSFSVFRNHKGRRYKVTRRLPELSVAETKVFTNKKRAKRLLDE